MSDERTVFIIGAARAGTSALAQFVASRFDLQLARGKETHYLAAGGIPRRSGGPHGAVFDRMRDTRASEFARRFTDGHASGRLEASTSSLYYASAAREALDLEFPDASLVAVLRDPAYRALSAYRYMRARGLEDLSWSDALDAEPARVRDGWPHIFHYAAEGMYSEQIRALGPWAERTLFLLYERDLADEDALVERIAAHTGLSPHSGIPLTRVNQAKEYPSRSVARFAERARSLPVVARTPAPVRAAARSLLGAVRREPRPSADIAGDPRLLEGLRTHQAAEVDGLLDLGASRCWH